MKVSNWIKMQKFNSRWWNFVFYFKISTQPISEPTFDTVICWVKKCFEKKSWIGSRDSKLGCHPQQKFSQLSTKIVASIICLRLPRLLKFIFLVVLIPFYWSRGYVNKDRQTWRTKKYRTVVGFNVILTRPKSTRKFYSAHFD